MSIVHLIDRLLWTLSHGQHLSGCLCRKPKKYVDQLGHVGGMLCGGLVVKAVFHGRYCFSSDILVPFIFHKEFEIDNQIRPFTLFDPSPHRNEDGEFAFWRLD